MADALIRTERLAVVFGGAGFIGRHVVRALVRDGWRVRVASRRPDLAFHLQPLGNVGQIHAVQANLRYPDSVARAVRGAQGVVNLVGILAPSGDQSFEAVHVEGARAIASAAKAARAERFAHLSALGADKASASVYGRTKAQGEAAVAAAFPEAVILRPSVVFGQDDQFFNRFAAMARTMPALPLIGGGATKLQPIFAGDVATAVALALAGAARPGAVYELGGPQIATLRQLIEFVLKITERKRRLQTVSFKQAKLIGGVTEFLAKISLGLLPGMFVVTKDQVELLKSDNIVSPGAIADGRTLQGLGVTPDSFEALVPTYLGRYRATGQFADRRLA